MKNKYFGGKKSFQPLHLIKNQNFFSSKTLVFPPTKKKVYFWIVGPKLFCKIIVSFFASLQPSAAWRPPKEFLLFSDFSLCDILHNLFMFRKFITSYVVPLDDCKKLIGYKWHCLLVVIKYVVFHKHTLAHKVVFVLQVPSY